MELGGVLGGNAELRSARREGVLHAPVGAHGDADLDAGGGCDPCLSFEVLPGHVEPLGADQREGVPLAAVLAHEGRREAEAPASLEIGRRPEDRGRQEVDLVIDDELPGAWPEQLEVGELPVAVGAPAEDLVGGERHRPGGLLLARVLRDVFRPERGLVEQLAAPLLHGGQADREHERRLLDQRHRGQAHDGLSGAAGEDDDPAASALGARAVERLGGVALIVA